LGTTEFLQLWKLNLAKYYWMTRVYKKILSYNILRGLFHIILKLKVKHMGALYRTVKMYNFEA
jgi:hypothetical protein